jgi:hypothetical protein
MKKQGIKWCGEGDLFSSRVLKTRNLYTLRRAQSSKSARRTKSSHTASHTALLRATRRDASGVPGSVVEPAAQLQNSWSILESAVSP